MILQLLTCRLFDILTFHNSLLKSQEWWSWLGSALRTLKHQIHTNKSEIQIHNFTVNSNGDVWEVHQGLSLVDWSCFIAGNSWLMKVFFLFFAAALSFVEESSFVFLFIFVFGAALSLAIMDRGGRQDGRNRREILLPRRGGRRGRN